MPLSDANVKPACLETCNKHPPLCWMEQSHDRLDNIWRLQGICMQSDAQSHTQQTSVITRRKWNFRIKRIKATTCFASASASEIIIYLFAWLRCSFCRRLYSRSWGNSLSSCLIQLFRRLLNVTQHLGVVPVTVAAFQLYPLSIFTSRVSVMAPVTKKACLSHPDKDGEVERKAFFCFFSFQVVLQISFIAVLIITLVKIQSDICVCYAFTKQFTEINWNVRVSWTA